MDNEHDDRSATTAVADTDRTDDSGTRAPQDQPTPSPETLRRALSRRQMRMIGIGGAIGTGLFLGSGQAISTAGPIIMIAYIVGGVVAAALAYALSNMIASHPEVAGFGGLTERFLGPAAAFAQRWWYWMAQVINVGSEAVAAAIYLRLWWPGIPLWLPVVCFAVLILTVNALTVWFFGEFEYWFAMIKVVAIVVFVVLGIIMITVGLPDQPATGVSAWFDHGGFAPHGLSGLWQAMVLVLFSYMGTEAMAVAAAEARDPGRDIVAATRGVIARLVLFYVLGTAVVVSVVPWTQAAASGGIDRSPFVRMFDIVGVPAAVHIMNAVVLTAALSAMNTNVYVTSRTLHGLAVSDQAPRPLARVSGRGVPLAALAVSGAGLLLAALLAAVAPARAFLAMVGLSLTGAVLTWIVIFATYLAYWRSRRSTATNRRFPAILAAAAVVAIVLLSALLITMATGDVFGEPVRAGLPLILTIGIVAWVQAVRRRRQRTRADVRPRV